MLSLISDSSLESCEKLNTSGAESSITPRERQTECVAEDVYRRSLLVKSSSWRFSIVQEAFLEAEH